MEDSGRNYIMLATALIVLAGAYHHHVTIDEQTAGPSQVITQAAASSQCDQNAIQLSRVRLGCNMGNGGDARVRDHTRTTSDEVKRGTSKTIILGGS